MTGHSPTKSAIFFAVGHATQKEAALSVRNAGEKLNSSCHA